MTRIPSKILAATFIIIALTAGCQPASPPPVATPSPTFASAEPSTPPPSSSPSLESVFPDVSTFPDWAPAEDIRLFDHENLYDLVDGQAESFFVYSFEQVAVQNYQDTEGAVLRIIVWQLATPADAYGLFTTSLAGQPVAVNADLDNGDFDPGRRLAFWQNRYYVEVRARQKLPDATLRDFAEVLSAALPSGVALPALVRQLPPEGLVERSTSFFHEELSIQDWLWLGGENILGLGPQTDGVLAQYEIGGTVAQLLLVQYPDAEAASASLAALREGQIDGLVAADAREELLGAVFGEANEAAASTLLVRALGK